MHAKDSLKCKVKEVNLVHDHGGMTLMAAALAGHLERATLLLNRMVSLAPNLQPMLRTVST